MKNLFCLALALICLSSAARAELYCNYMVRISGSKIIGDHQEEKGLSVVLRDQLRNVRTKVHLDSYLFKDADDLIYGIHGWSKTNYIAIAAEEGVFNLELTTLKEKFSLGKKRKYKKIDEDILTFSTEEIFREEVEEPFEGLFSRKVVQLNSGLELKLNFKKSCF